MHRIALLLTLVVLTGCFSYAHTPGPAPLGRDVEIELTDAGSANMARLVGPNVISIRGRTTEVRGDSLHLAVESILKRRGTDELWSNEPLAIAHSDISSVSTRRFSVARSSLLALTVIGGAVVVLTTDIVEGGGSGKPRPPPQ